MARKSHALAKARSSHTPALGLAALMTSLVVLLLAASAARADEPGVTVYEMESFRGHSATFSRDQPRFDQRTPIGNDRARSIALSPGCTATVYEHYDYKGRSMTITADTASLRNGLGLDETSSLRVDCRRAEALDRRGTADRRGPRGRYDEDDQYRGQHRDGDRYQDDRYRDDRDRDGFPVRRDDQYRDDRQDHRDRDTYYDSRSTKPMRWADGVVLFRDRSFNGEQSWLRDSVSDLGRERVGNDQVTSLKVSPGCVATLYQDNGYRGRSLEVDHDLADLGATVFGSDRLSSIKVDCSGWDTDYVWGKQRGAVLFPDAGYRGQPVNMYTDDADLRNDPIGSDRLSSIRVEPGCQVELFADANFRGTSYVLDRDAPTLDYTPVGNDRVSSIRIQCDDRRGSLGRSGHRDGYGNDGRRGYGLDDHGVTLFSDANFRGASEVLDRDDPRLDDNRIGNDRASSIRVARGCVAMLYAEGNYRGKGMRVDRDVADLGTLGFGNDRLSSIKVDCPRRRR